MLRAVNRYLTLGEAAKAIGMPKNTLQRRIDRGRMHSTLVDGRRLVAVGELQRIGLLNEDGTATRVRGGGLPPAGDSAPSATEAHPVAATAHTAGIETIVVELTRLAEQIGRHDAVVEKIVREVTDLRADVTELKAHPSRSAISADTAPTEEHPNEDPPPTIS